MDNLTMKELQALYEYISKLDPNTEEYKAAVDAIVLLEKVQLDKDKLAIQQDENGSGKAKKSLFSPCFRSRLLMKVDKLLSNKMTIKND